MPAVRALNLMESHQRLPARIRDLVSCDVEQASAGQHPFRSADRKSGIDQLSENRDVAATLSLTVNSEI